MSAYKGLFQPSTFDIRTDNPIHKGDRIFLVPSPNIPSTSHIP
ncbi:hypothetical protein [Cylindrospermopsis raciborskii]